MDEPFASVDARTRDRLHAELLNIWARTGQTVVFVTHDVDEAVPLADRIVVMDTEPGTVGSIVPVDTDRPRRRTAREFVEHVARIRDELGSPRDGGDVSPTTGLDTNPLCSATILLSGPSRWGKIIIL
jgi:NitT/TauT family transport system ATP-binding protein